MRLTFVILLILTIMISHGQQEQRLPENTRKKVFLFAGQSNMDGRANGDVLNEKDLERLSKVAPRIQFYYNHKPVTSLQLTTPTPFLQDKFKFKTMFGPELFFGIEMAEKYPEDEFIFIKRSIGGTSLYGCWNPDWTYEKASLVKEENKPKLYFDFVDYTKTALKSYNPEAYEIKGMFWVQGEHDSNVNSWGEKPASSYGDHLKNLISTVRQDFDSPKLPFIMFQVGNQMVVDGMIRNAKEDKNVFVITQEYDDKNSADYYPQYDPPLWHYTTESMKRIGIEFFKIYDLNFN
ncbi:sialate O-acetylesterase [Gaetbulibacter sp. M240]|uniref:sialate O-acetylesterase n=1 Tax=Gaetbulibacter sp. M240 TaxID=3126511 RepID=UPI00374E8FB2